MRQRNLFFFCLSTNSSSDSSPSTLSEESASYSLLPLFTQPLLFLGVGGWEGGGQVDFSENSDPEVPSAPR